MSERERWVVYPLLFLALGAALRDKLVDRTTAKSIRCQELVVADDSVEGQAERWAIKIGHTDAATPQPVIQCVGDIVVDGVVKAKAVDADQYAFHNVVIPMALQQVPGKTAPRGVQVPQKSDPSGPKAKKGEAVPKPPSPPAAGKSAASP